MKTVSGPYQAPLEHEPDSHREGKSMAWRLATTGAIAGFIAPVAYVVYVFSEASRQLVAAPELDQCGTPQVVAIVAVILGCPLLAVVGGLSLGFVGRCIDELRR